jgi:hypothetical protein
MAAADAAANKVPTAIYKSVLASLLSAAFNNAAKA